MTKAGVNYPAVHAVLLRKLRDRAIHVLVCRGLEAKVVEFRGREVTS